MIPEEDISILVKKVEKDIIRGICIFVFFICILLGVLLLSIPHASAAHDYYDVRPTIDSNPTHQDSFKQQQTYGTLKVMLRCKINTISDHFILKNVGANVSQEYPIDHNGNYEGEFVPGTYYAILPDGNGGQKEEFGPFNITAKETSYVLWLGHAVSPKAIEIIKKPTVQPTVTPTPSCHYHDGHWERKCIGSGHHKYCFDIWIPGYWHCGGCSN